MSFENEKREFINKHLLKIEDITEDILKQMDKAEGIIITTENGKIIDIDAVWSTDDEYEDCWEIRIYESYEDYVGCSHYNFWDSVCMEDFTVNHIKSYMSYTY